MHIHVDPSSPEPLFAQIVSEVKSAVATGRAKPGDRLPSVRELARELVINPNTIAKAYQVLEAEGVTRSRRGAGTFVAQRRIVVTTAESERRIRADLEALLAEAVHLGVSEEEIRRLFDEALAEIRFVDPRGLNQRGGNRRGRGSTSRDSATLGGRG